MTRLHSQASTPVNTNKPIVWSDGLGTQSAAIWLLIENGKLPMPDIIMIADTSREARRSWKYNIEHIFPRMLKAGANVHIAPHSLSHVDLYADNGDLLIPAFTPNGKLPGFCSSKWKVMVVRRYLKALYGESFKCTMWLGMSTDEVERLKDSDVQWAENAWPLCGMPRSYDYGIRMNRADCIQYVLAHGLPEPPKSACYICGHTKNKEWREMKEQEPEDFAAAVKVDYLIRSQASNLKATDLYLHPSRLPLDQVDFTKPSEPTLFGCDSGFCWT